jgi:hypothetical protein
MGQEIKLTKNEYKKYGRIRNEKRLSPTNAEYIAHLHSKYFNHSYYFPCSCNKSTWQQWISQLNTLYDNTDEYDRGY